MKKKAGKIIAIVLCIVIAAGGITAYALLPHSLNFDIDSIEKVGTDTEFVNSTEDTVTIKTDKKDFKVLMFTDLHLDGKNETSLVTVTNLVENIQKEKPDLVILGGDNVTSALNKKRANQLCEIFEKLGVYWAAVLGNHEGDNKFTLSREEMTEIFSSYDHCLMLKGLEDLFGVGNYQLNVLNGDNTLRQSFFMFDSGDEMSSELMKKYDIPEDDPPYDGTKDNQVEWYEKRVAETKKEYGEFKSCVVLHIPLPQYQEAFDTNELIRGEKREGICASGFDSGLFEAIKKSKSTTNVFCGHDHVNDFSVEFEGITLNYIQASGYGSYSMRTKFDAEEKDWLQGYTLLNIKKGGEIEQSRFLNSEKSS